MKLGANVFFYKYRIPFLGFWETTRTSHQTVSHGIPISLAISLLRPPGDDRRYRGLSRSNILAYCDDLWGSRHRQCVVKITEKYVCFLEDFSFWKPFEFDECVKMDGCKNGPSNKGWLLCDAPRVMKELHRSSSFLGVPPSIEPAGPPTNGKPMVFTTASSAGKKINQWSMAVSGFP